LAQEFFDPTRQSPHTPQPQTWNSTTITAAWLGHATVLINFCGLTLITDPVLSNRIGPSLRSFTFGPKRRVAPALRASQLPAVDVVLLSHAHLDHLHIGTMASLPATIQIVTAAGTGDLLRGIRSKEVHELSWGEQVTLTTHHGTIRLEAFAVQHWGTRWKTDTHRKFNGYILERNGRKIIFGGDTGYTTAFRDLKAKGPFDFAIMPIGSYKPGENSHCTPEEAVEMARDAGAEILLPIHHQTFNLGRESMLEPIQRLAQALPASQIGWKEIGQTFQVC
jgi:L-ascorbate metabolism protein UlaG (beta-lactamase superfamily)